MNGYEKYGEARAISYVQQIYDKLSMLCEFPNLGHTHPDLPRIYLTLKVEKQHIAVYRIDGEVIHIIRIFYSGFDFARHDLSDPQRTYGADNP